MPRLLQSLSQRSRQLSARHTLKGTFTQGSLHLGSPIFEKHKTKPHVLCGSIELTIKLTINLLALIYSVYSPRLSFRDLEWNTRMALTRLSMSSAPAVS